MVRPSASGRNRALVAPEHAEESARIPWQQISKMGENDFECCCKYFVNAYPNISTNSSFNCCSDRPLHVHEPVCDLSADTDDSNGNCHWPLISPRQEIVNNSHIPIAKLSRSVREHHH